MEIEKYNAIAANPAIQKALRRIELFVNNLHIRKPTRAFWEQLKRESFESINAALEPQNKETKAMEPKKTIADLKAAMWGLFEKLPEEKRQKTDFIAIDSIGRSWSYFSIKCFEKYWGRDGEKLGNIDLADYPPDAWKQSLIEVRDGKRVDETPTPHASSGFVPVKMEDFDENGELRRGVFTISKRHSIATGNLISVKVLARGFDGWDYLVHEVQTLPDLNIFLEQQWLALGGKKGDE